jgi:hypothetical protein
MPLQKVIPNDQLTPGDVPQKDADWSTISRFALTYNGYTEAGSFEKCGEIANEHRNSTLDELRTCLFFEQRRWRHFGRLPDDESMKYIRGVVEQIRTKLKIV